MALSGLWEIPLCMPWDIMLYNYGAAVVLVAHAYGVSVRTTRTIDNIVYHASISEL